MSDLVKSSDNNRARAFVNVYLLCWVALERSLRSIDYRHTGYRKGTKLIGANFLTVVEVRLSKRKSHFIV